MAYVFFWLLWMNGLISQTRQDLRPYAHFVQSYEIERAPFTISLPDQSIDRANERRSVARKTVSVTSTKTEAPEMKLHAAAEAEEIADDHETTTQESEATFPAFGEAVWPVSNVPNWGAMRTSAEWNRSYEEMAADDFVDIPSYDPASLTFPMALLARSPIPERNIPAITAKLFYSTRHFGRYDLDSGEFAAPHPGIDLKLAPKTPISAIGGGLVHQTGDDSRLGRFVTVEHRIDEMTYFSIYGHLDDIMVTEGQKVTTGDMIGTVGMTGNTTGPHVHFQVDLDDGSRPHIRYQPSTTPSRAEAQRFTVHPVTFLTRYARR